MRDFSLDFVPIDGFNGGWLKEIYGAYVARSRAVGKDGVKPRAFLERIDLECELIANKVNAGTYRFTAYREKLIARGAHRRPRQISIPTIRDRLALRGALQFLKAHFPTARPRPPHLFIKEIKAHLANARKHSSFLRMDIQDFYPSLRHDLLEDMLRSSELPNSVVSLIMAAVSTKTGTNTQAAPRLGVPQGLSVSNALAAIYMTKFDQGITGEEMFYRRYVDDILVIDHSERVTATYQKLWAGLNEIGLKSHPMGTVGKTETSLLPEGVQYLGYEISLSQISIRHPSLSKMFTNLSKVITCFRRNKDQQRHLFRLNLKITGCVINNARRGWLMFFSQTENISQLAYLDSWLILETEKYKISRAQLKKFKKAYYEIRYNLELTSYIPNFDKFSLDQKKETISVLSSRNREEIEAMNVETIEIEFGRLIGKEVSELERDLVEAFS